MEQDTDGTAIRVSPEPAALPAAYTVRQFLDADLDRLRRAADLEQLTGRFTSQPLAGTVTDLRTELASGIDMEQFRRLHILISHLYHACGADIPLTTDLRSAVAQALTPERPYDLHARREETHVLSESRLPPRRLLDRRQADHDWPAEAVTEPAVPSSVSWEPS